MPAVEKTSGGVVYVRMLDRRFAIGDRVDVSAEQAERLVGRGDFERVSDELDEADVDEDDPVDTLEKAGAADGESTSGGPSESDESDAGTAADEDAELVDANDKLDNDGEWPDDDTDTEICGTEKSDGTTCERAADECPYHDDAEE